MNERASAGRILIVEDEAVVAVDLQAQLERFGYVVVGVAASAVEAGRLADQRRPDLVLMDIQLGPQGDGVESARSISEDLELPVVFLTAFSDQRTIERARAVGAYGYLVKPFDERELHSTIQTAIEKSHHDQAVRKRRDDLLAILDAQRQGTIALDEKGRVCFLSRAAESMLQIGQDEALTQRWQDILPLDAQNRQDIEHVLDKSPSERKPLTLRLQHKLPVRVVEVEAQDDPRDPRRKLVFLYDVSQLFDLRQLLDERSRFENMVGKSEPMRQVFQLVAEVAPVDASVLIEGETGTGKELVARAIHNRSHRREGLLLALNCAGLGDDLAASQLFGHRRGAFTGAVESQPGLFEAADGGTLFLDEIGELPSRVQTMLLRVLEEKAIRRLGDVELRPVDVRVIAATNRDLTLESAEGAFRTDLLYRLRVCCISIPPLRERREDVPLLVRQFVAEHAAALGKRVERASDEALCVLLAHDWPGNVRELRNALEFAVIRARKATVEAADLPPEVLESAARAGLLDEGGGDDRGRILAALERTGGNRKEAAKLLGISRATLYRRLASLEEGEVE